MPTQTETEPPASGCTRLADTIRHFSQRLIAAQRSLRLLDALQWDKQVEWTFLSNRATELPRVTRDDYLSRRLPFELDRKQMEFQDLERDVERKLGSREGVGRILVRMCREYTGVVRLLAYRGTRVFSSISASLFGTTRGQSPTSDTKVLDDLCRNYEPRNCLGPTCDSNAAANELTTRLGRYFPENSIRVRLADRIGADACAGTRQLRIRDNAQFTQDDIRLLEVHEGWIHLGTSMNAIAQPICTFLRKGPPSSTRTQEGLAVLTEFLGGASHPKRIQRLRQRVRAIQMAEQGADFLQVFRTLRESEGNDRDCFQQTARVFRGSLPSGCGPFTKDLCYVQGLNEVVHAVRQLQAANRTEHVSLLFCGKTSAGDIDTLAELAQAGLLLPPRFVPPPFCGLNAL